MAVTAIAAFARVVENWENVFRATHIALGGSGRRANSMMVVVGILMLMHCTRSHTASMADRQAKQQSIDGLDMDMPALVRIPTTANQSNGSNNNE